MRKDARTVFGWLTALTGRVAFPVLFVRILFQYISDQPSRWWDVIAWLACWLPMMISTWVDNAVFNQMTGYYHDYVQSHIDGYTETAAVEKLIVYVQWIWITVFTGILFVRSKRSFKDV